MDFEKIENIMKKTVFFNEKENIHYWSEELLSENKEIIDIIDSIVDLVNENPDYKNLEVAELVELVK